MSLAYAHFITPIAALALVLGANLGSAINPIFEGARRDNPASYRLPLGNFINRLVGVLLVAPFLRPITEILQVWQPDLAKLAAEMQVGSFLRQLPDNLRREIATESGFQAPSPSVLDEEASQLPAEKRTQPGDRRDRDGEPGTGPHTDD